MSSYTLSNNAADIDAAISSVVGADAAPIAGSQNMITSGGVKTYVDAEIGALDSRVTVLESEVANLNLGTATAVSLSLTSEFSTSSESFQNLPLSAQGQPPFFTDNGNNTFTILEGNYLIWFSFSYRSQYDSAANEIEVQFNTLNGMSDLLGIGVFRDYGIAYKSYLKQRFRNVNQDTTFSLQIRDETEAGNNRVYIKDLILTLLKV